MPALASFRSFASLVLLSALPAQILTVSGVPTFDTGVGGAVSMDLTVVVPSTLTQIDFWTGASTPAGATVTVDLYLTYGTGFTITTPGYPIHIGTTAAVTTQVAGAQLLSAIVVPTASFPSPVLPAGPYGLTLIAHNAGFGTQAGNPFASTADLRVYGQCSWSSSPLLGGSMSFWRSFVGAVHYAVGGTPINLQDVTSFGTSCAGLTLTATGTPTPGSTVNFVTSNPTSPGFGLLMLTADPGLSMSYQAGVDLLLIGAPGCRAYVLPDTGVNTVIGNFFPGVSMTVPLAVPAFLPLAGAPFFAQSVWLDATQNAVGLVTSNAVRVRIG